MTHVRMIGPEGVGTSAALGKSNAAPTPINAKQRCSTLPVTHSDSAAQSEPPTAPVMFCLIVPACNTPIVPDSLALSCASYKAQNSPLTPTLLSLRLYCCAHTHTHTTTAPRSRVGHSVRSGCQHSATNPSAVPTVDCCACTDDTTSLSFFRPARGKAGSSKTQPHPGMVGVGHGLPDPWSQGPPPDRCVLPLTEILYSSKPLINKNTGVQLQDDATGRWLNCGTLHTSVKIKFKRIGCCAAVLLFLINLNTSNKCQHIYKISQRSNARSPQQPYCLLGQSIPVQPLL